LWHHFVFIFVSAQSGGLCRHCRGWGGSGGGFVVGKRGIFWKWEEKVKMESIFYKKTLEEEAQ
jgi:hypothetical protein